ncbi:MAG: LicD family protein [Clostridia bacterium]|nr:LicD family protein [Clostridia bacterium]
MKPISFEETKKIEFDILVGLTDFCDKHNLNYYLAYGSLIGAVRHNGFIPWDDDIDIIMPRPDYEKLIEIFNKENENSSYRLIAPTDKNSRHSIVKVIDTKTVKIEKGVNYKNGHLGIDVDVFPLDGAPENEQEYNEWYDKLMLIYKKFVYGNLSFKSASFRTKLGIILRKIIWPSPKKCLKLAKKLHEQYPYDNSKFVAVVESAFNGRGNRVEKSCYDEFTLLNFEGKSFKAPKEYDKVLTNLYGDYMKLPPKEKQVTHHLNNTFYKD